MNNKESVEIGTRTKTELQKEMKENFQISPYARSMMKSKDFVVAKKPAQIDFVRLSVKGLGFENGASTKELYDKAEELGFKFCPAEMGPQLRIKYRQQPLNERLYIFMQPILGPDDRPAIFYIMHGKEGLWLHGGWARPTDHWLATTQLCFIEKI